MVFFLLLLSLVYFYVLRHPPKKIWLIILASVIITFPAFPAALSRDVYNYAMDAKTITVFHQNPWVTPPKAHPADSLFSHIAWPNDPTRYGPVWVLPTSALYSIWPSLYSFKLITVLCYLGTLYIIKKLAKTDRAVIFLAFNPLLIVEYYLGTHTDIAMTFLALLAIYKLSWPAMFGSLLVKITSLPLSVGFFIKNAYVWIWLAYLGSLIIITAWSINPWYFTLPVILSALVLKSYFHKYLAISLSLAAVVRYIPLLYMGPFDPHNKIRAFLFLILLVPFGLWTLKKSLTSIKDPKFYMASESILK